MEEYINKVKLNLDFYKGTDIYSDGDIEDDILNIVKYEEDLEKYLTTDDRWPILYHLSNIRKNLVNWYDFDPDASLLEIGSGCGAVTGAFCEKCRRVVGVDLSKRRSTINAYRNKAYDNLEIMVGNFEGIKFAEKFDYITLIGVLEYSIYYINSDQPFLDMLKKTKSLLKPGGTLIVAIENKYGIKYWAGAPEDHTGRAFDGIEGYPGVERVRTFSRQGLERLLKEAGYTENQFYYPVPDYKMPMSVYSEKYIPSHGIFDGNSPAYDRDRLQIFDEVKAIDELSKEGMFPFFANSFLTFSR